MGLRADLGWLSLGEGLCGIALLMGLLNQTAFAVFLVPLGSELLWGGVMQCGRVTRGSWKVMHLAVFLKLPGLGG